MIRDTIDEAVAQIRKTCQREDVFNTSVEGVHLPNRGRIIGIIKELRRVIFPGYFGDEDISSTSPDYFLGSTMTEVYEALRNEVMTAFIYNESKLCSQAGRNCSTCDPQTRTEMEMKNARKASEICEGFIAKLPEVQELLLLDVEAALNGDPAAQSKEDIIFSYPGLFAIYVYRLAHILYQEKVPMIPRIMTEYAHSRTGIDINSGAVIGKYFCIDHGTGIVIGETCRIGDYVKLYQGVTLGALSTRKGRQLIGVRRHPTIEDHVTIYSNSSILGGDTVIGSHSVIGGNCFITQSIEPYSRVYYRGPKHEIDVVNVDEGHDSSSPWD